MVPEPNAGKGRVGAGLDSQAAHAVRMRLVGGNARARIIGLDELPGKSNYFLGNDPKKWRTNVATYARVKYENLYPGIDLVYYGNQGQLEYDFVVAPGADPGVIKFDISPTAKVEINNQGDLVLRADGGNFRLHKPLVYQPLVGVNSQQSKVQDSTDKAPRTTDVGSSKLNIANPKLVEGHCQAPAT